MRAQLSCQAQRDGISIHRETPLMALLILSAAMIVGQGCGAAMKIANTSFEVTDYAGTAAIKRVGIVNGASLEFNKKRPGFDTVFLECTDKMRRRLVTKLTERAGSLIVVVPDKTVIARLIDPFRIVSRREAKQMTGVDPDEMTMTLDQRSWADCANCKEIADSLGVDALWVIWGRWFSAEQDQSKVHYEKKDKGWLHTSGHLFSTADGHLLAWTSINRTGLGIWPFRFWGKAYSFISGGMAKNFAKAHRP